MEHQLSLEEADILDNIIEIAINKSKTTYVDLEPLKERSPLFTPFSLHSKYSYFFELLKTYNIVQIYYTLDLGYYAKPIPIITQQFYKDSGFKRIYEEQQLKYTRQQDKEQLELKQLKFNTKLLEKQNRYFTPNLIMTIITVVCTIITIGFTIYTLNNPK